MVRLDDQMRLQEGFGKAKLDSAKPRLTWHGGEVVTQVCVPALSFPPLAGLEVRDPELVRFLAQW